MTKILLVEDDKSLREIYGVRLLAEGYDIVSAGDGEEALAMAIKEKPKLIISDVMMPKISGFDMLDILRSTTETRDIKVIMMTALSSDDQRNRGEQLGADRYLVKSQVGIEDVVRTVHEVLEDSAQVAASTPVAPTAPATAAAPVVATTDDTATTPSSDSTSASTDGVTAAASAAPGNDGAGPLPPQPEIAEDTSLPQPTAPFTSPRPTNLGERVIQPLEGSDEPSVTAEEIARELQAPADPVTSQVDESPSDISTNSELAATSEPVSETQPSTDSEPAVPAPVFPDFNTPEPAPAQPAQDTPQPSFGAEPVTPIAETPAANPAVEPFMQPAPAFPQPATDTPSEQPASTSPSVPPIQPQ